MRVLIVDDMPDNLELLRLAFGQYAPGVEIETAQSAAEALGLYHGALERGAAFDAIVSDIAMPQQSGLSLIQEIRQGGDDKTRVYFCTAFDNTLNRQSAKDLNMSGYFIKPAPLAALVDMVTQNG